MHKILFITIGILINTAYTYAQQHEPVNPQKDKIEFQGYTIKLNPGEAGGYGYDIFLGNTLVVHQGKNPFTMAPIGLDKKQDVYKIAKWQVQELKKENSEQIPGAPPQGQVKPGKPDMQSPPSRRGPQSNQPIPRKVAQELNIQL
jgi:hypothetical protein